ncbi:MAG: hypothetical protein AB7I42_30250 [Bradyrhizobium sp.]|uniref:hypothetical protein n=1 Tax=Bradyrhizobium sp. TaxID=376 RepID=UPI003D13D430
MDPTQQQRGDFVAFLNRNKQPGDKRPMFEGRIAKPGSDETHPLTLWAHQYADPRTGEVKTMYSGTIGPVSPDAAPADQVERLIQTGDAADLAIGNLTIRPRQVVLFPNGFKDEAPDRKRPDLWGAANFGDGSELVRSSVWLIKARNGNAMMSGATSYPIPGKSEADMQRDEGGLEELIARGEVSKGMPAKKRAKAGRGD